MRNFNLDDKYTVLCNDKATSNGFKHIARVFLNSIEQGSVSIGYINRTWERFEYEDVLLKAIKKFVEKSEHQKYIDIVKTIN